MACTLMGVELFGATHIVYLAAACFIAYLCSGHSGIYLSQRIAIPKTDSPALPPDISLRNVRAMHSSPIDRITASLAGRNGADHAILNGRHESTPIQNESATMQKESTTMPHKEHRVAPREVGMIRIYLKPSDRRKQSGWRGFLNSRPLYRELVDAAKKEGFMNAVAHHTHYGFSNHGRVRAHDPETGSPNLTMCVELIAAKDRLDLFCRTYGELLIGKVIVCHPIEHWEIQTG